MLRGDRKVHALHDEQHVLPYLPLFSERLVTQQVSGVLGGHERDSLKLVPMPSQPSHGLDAPEQAFHSNGTKRYQDDGFNDFDLGAEVRETGLHLGGAGAAVAAGAGGHVGTAFEDIRDEDLASLHAHGFDDFCEQLPGLAHERLALQVFIGAGGLADEHDLGFDIADAEDGLRARAGEVGAFGAWGYGGAQLIDPFEFGGAGGREDVHGRLNGSGLEFRCRRRWGAGPGAGGREAAEGFARAAEVRAGLAELPQGVGG
jgi:hypothetical protein